MHKNIKFNKRRIAFGLIFWVIMLLISVWFITEPELFIRNFLMKAKHIQFAGGLGIFYFSLLIFSFVKILHRKIALTITEDFFFDNTSYESLGKIDWKEVSKIKRKKKRNIEVFLNKPIFDKNGINIVKKILLISKNWNYKESILISSALMECSIENLFQSMKISFEDYKRTHSK